MATFKACVQQVRKDGFYSVYIRVTHRRQTSFIKTDKMVDKKGLNRSGDIKDTVVLSYCLDRINVFMDQLNKEDISDWTIKDVIEFLEKGDNDICFSDYARRYKLEMSKRGQERNARNYQLSYQHSI